MNLYDNAIGELETALHFLEADGGSEAQIRATRGLIALAVAMKQSAQDTEKHLKDIESDIMSSR
jgi:hypothetical protein